MTKSPQLAKYFFTRQKIPFAIAIAMLTLVGFVSTSLISYYVAHRAVVEQVTESALPLTSDNIYSEIQRDLMQPIFTSSLMAHDTFVRDWALNGEQNLQPMTKYLAEIQQKYHAITAFYVSENTRNYYHSTGMLRKVQEGNSIDAWFFRVKKLNDDYEINIDHDTANPERLTVFVNYKVFDFNNNLIGVTGLGLALSKVQSLIDTYQQKYQRTVYFVNSSGEMTLRSLTYPGHLKTLQQPKFTQLIKHEYAQTNQVSFSYKSDGDSVYVNLRYIPEFDWYVVIEQNNLDKEKQLVNSLLLNIAISVLMSIIVLTLSYFTIARYQQKLENMAVFDKLSEAFNRHSFGAIFTHHKSLAERNKSTFSGILLDIDHFKLVNDNFGHLVGDSIIKDVANIIRSQIRDSDSLCRWGGEEFLILLPDCNLLAAQKVAEQIRLKFIETDFSHHQTLTASFGVAEFTTTERLWLQQMDSALYQAKNSGRNQVVTNSDNGLS